MIARLRDWLRDGDGDDESWDWGRVAALGIAGLLMFSPAAYALVSSFETVKTVHWKTDSGLVLKQTKNQSVTSGNPFVDSNTIDFQGVRFSGKSATVDPIAYNSAGWTNVSVSNTANGQVIVNRSGSKPMGAAGGGIDRLNISDQTDLSNATNTELIASAGNSWTLIMNNTGKAQGTEMLAVDPENKVVLGTGTVDANGDVTFQIDAVQNQKINIRVGVSELRVFQETDANKLVKGKTLRIRFFEDGEEKIVQKTTTDGTVDMSGVPSGKEITITVDDGPDYTYRRITLKSVFQQASAYLLNTTKSDVTAADVVFELDDRTGRYPRQNTTLFIKKPITKDFDNDGTNETRYETIAGDDFGAGGEFPATLAVDNRYRLIVENEQGDRRVIGSYTAKANDRSTIRIGTISIKGTGDDGWDTKFETFKFDSNNDGKKEQWGRVIVIGQERRIENVNYSIETRKGTTIVGQKTVTGPIGEYVATYKLNKSLDNTTYVLNYSVTRQDENGTDVTYDGDEYAGDVPQVAALIPLDQKWKDLLGFVILLSVTGLIVISDAVLAAFAAVVVGGLLTMIGMIAIPWPALGLAGAVSVLSLFGRDQGG